MLRRRSGAKLLSLPASLGDMTGFILLNRSASRVWALPAIEYLVRPQNGHFRERRHHLMVTKWGQVRRETGKE
jgi:hypothetical protein